MSGSSDATLCARQSDGLRIYAFALHGAACVRLFRRFDLCIGAPSEKDGAGLLLDGMSLQDGPDGGKARLHFANTLHKEGDTHQRDGVATAEIREFPDLPPDDHYSAAVAACRC